MWNAFWASCGVFRSFSSWLWLYLFLNIIWFLTPKGSRQFRFLCLICNDESKIEISESRWKSRSFAFLTMCGITFKVVSIIRWFIFLTSVCNTVSLGLIACVYEFKSSLRWKPNALTNSNWIINDIYLFEFMWDYWVDRYLFKAVNPRNSPFVVKSFLIENWMGQLGFYRRVLFIFHI